MSTPTDDGKFAKKKTRLRSSKGLPLKLEFRFEELVPLFPSCTGDFESVRASLYLLCNEYIREVLQPVDRAALRAGFESLLNAGLGQLAENIKNLEPRIGKVNVQALVGAMAATGHIRSYQARQCLAFMPLLRDALEQVAIEENSSKVGPGYFFCQWLTMPWREWSGCPAGKSGEDAEARPFGRFVVGVERLVIEAARESYPGRTFAIPDRENAIRWATKFRDEDHGFRRLSAAEK